MMANAMPHGLSVGYPLSRTLKHARPGVTSLKLPGLVAGAILLLAGTVMVFEAFDRQSHSASDTIRPFVITMAPVWAVAIAAVVVLLRRRTK